MEYGSLKKYCETAEAIRISHHQLVRSYIEKAPEPMVACSVIAGQAIANFEALAKVLGKEWAALILYQQADAFAVAHCEEMGLTWTPNPNHVNQTNDQIKPRKSRK